MRLLLALIVLVTSPTLAFAHTTAGASATLFTGFGHPLGGSDHLLAMLMVGVLAAVLGGRARVLVPLSFLAMMLVGFGLGALQIGLPHVELAIALSSVVIGLAAALQRPLPLAAATALVASFAIFHGHAHGAEMPLAGNALRYALGFSLATALICLSGMAATAAVMRHNAVLARIAAGLGGLLGVGLMAGWLQG